MSDPLHVIWKHNDKVLHGFDLSDGTWKDNPFNYGVAFPDKLTDPKEILLQSSGMQRRSYDILTDVEIYVDGDPATVKLLTVDWPALGCGIEISQDNGATFQLVTGRVPLLASAISIDAADGQLGPFDVARLLIRARVPGDFQDYGRLQFQLAVDCDVI